MTVKYYPVCLDIRNRPCLVVGGGAVGTRKVLTLLECGARVTVVSPAPTPQLEDLAREERIRLKRRPYRSSDGENRFLVIGATDDEALNRRIHQDAEGRNQLCNIADRPDICNFILPALVRRGDLTIAVSTAGNSPALAKRLRQQLEKQFGDEYPVFLELMGAIRTRLLSEAHAPEAHKPLFERIIASGIIDHIRNQEFPAVDAILLDILGEGYTFDGLLKKPG